MHESRALPHLTLNLALIVYLFEGRLAEIRSQVEQDKGIINDLKVRGPSDACASPELTALEMAVSSINA